MSGNGIETEDKTGQPRSDDEIKEAILVVEKEIVKVDFGNPTLFLQLPTIRESLKELLLFREHLGKKKFVDVDKDVFVTNEDGDEIDIRRM